MHPTARAFAALARRYTDGPTDAPLSPCAHCGYPVESVDARGRCDDCAHDLRVMVRDEVDALSLAVAVQLGRVSLAARGELAARAWRVAA